MPRPQVPLDEFRRGIADLSVAQLELMSKTQNLSEVERRNVANAIARRRALDAEENDRRSRDTEDHSREHLERQTEAAESQARAAQQANRLAKVALTLSALALLISVANVIF